MPFNDIRIKKPVIIKKIGTATLVNAMKYSPVNPGNGICMHTIKNAQAAFKISILSALLSKL